MSFDSALAFTLGREGGFSDHPDDPGGATFRGVTQSTFSAFLRSRGLSERPVSGMTEAELRAIYRRYWDDAGCPYLPERLAACAFDAAVNMGPGQAIRQLQRALWVEADGAIGPATIRAAQEVDELRAVYAMLTLRREFYAELAKRTGPTFLRGWIARVAALWRTVAGA